MTIHKSRILAVGLLAAGVLLGAAPASAEPLPNPSPDQPFPVPAPEVSSTGLCQGGEMQEGNCIPGMSPVGENIGGPVPEPERITQDVTSGSESGIPVESVPNINGDPCTGAFESTVCYAEQQGDSAPGVVPRSTLSSSP